MVAPGLFLREVRKSFPGFELGPLSLDLVPGTVMGLLGPNGAGKTTLLNLIALQSRAGGGEMAHGGVPVAWGDVHWKSRISYVREAPAFYDELTVAETLNFASRVYDEWDGAFAESLARRLRLDRSRRVGTLSKGTRVKLGLVVALAHHASFVLLDEPTAGLDPEAREDLQDVVRGLLRQPGDVSVLFSSHLFDDLDAVADQVTIIRTGRIVFQYARAELADFELYRLPAGVEVAGLSAARLAWVADGRTSVLVTKDSPLRMALRTVPGCKEDPAGVTLPTIYRATQYL